MKNNLWVSKKNPIAMWIGELSLAENAAEVIKTVVQEVLGLGEKEQVYRVLSTRGKYPYSAASGITYWEYLQQLPETERFKGPLLAPGYPGKYPDGEVLTPGRVCYYGLKDRLIDLRGHTESEVNDLGELLKSLEPGIKDSPFTTSSGSPVMITIGRVTEARGKDTLSINVVIHSDIWFPHVRALYSEQREQYPSLDMWDNSELAFCHTPRFNRFLDGIAQLIKDLGGSWYLVREDIGDFSYHSMLTDHGIILG